MDVHPSIVSRLIDLNRQFYQTFALQFSGTRQRLQPGVLRVVESLPATANLMDLGCGNGELARALANRGQQGAYLGLDFSLGLLQEAAKRQAPGSGFTYHFLQADLSAPGWETPLLDFHPDWIMAFAVLHHLPGSELRQQVLGKVRSLLKPGGRFAFSVWQFLNSPRLKARIQPWEAAGLSDADVEPGDYLLDWRQGGRALRYVHHFNQEELGTLAAKTGFRVAGSFFSDGEGGRLGLYQVWN
jgi:tRNA (uracil-5-)-methyltransferase TRM9